MVLDLENNYPKISQKEIKKKSDFPNIFFLLGSDFDSDEDFDEFYNNISEDDNEYLYGLWEKKL